MQVSSLSIIPGLLAFQFETDKLKIFPSKKVLLDVKSSVKIKCNFLESPKYNKKINIKRNNEH